MSVYVHFTSTPTPLGVFIARGKEDALVTRNMVPGETVYGEKKVSVEIVSSLLAGIDLLRCVCSACSMAHVSCVVDW